MEDVLCTGTRTTRARHAWLTDIVCQLRGTAPNLPPIVAAAAMGHAEAVRALLDRGADPNATAAFDPSVTALNAATAAHTRLTHVAALSRADAASMESRR